MAPTHDFSYLPPIEAPEPENVHHLWCCAWHVDDDETCTCHDPDACQHKHPSTAQRIDLIAPANEETS